MIGGNGTQTEEQGDGTTEATAALRAKDPEGFDAWLAVIKGAAAVRVGLDKDSIAPAWSS